MHVRRVGNSYMTNFFAGGNLFFTLLEHKRPLSLVCKIQTMSGSPASSWPPVLENVSARTSSWLRSTVLRSSALPGGSRLLSVPGNSGADSYTSQSERGALPGTYTHVKKAPGFIRLSLCTRRSAASASADTGTDMPALSRMQNITTSL